MNKLQIDCFMEISISGSLTKAANNLYLTPQVVSKHIHNLEKELGFPLFSRSKAGMKLTDRGLLFYEDASRWTELYDATLQKIDEYYSDLATSLRIGVSEYVDITGEISKGIAAFRDQHQDVLMEGHQYKNRILLQEVEHGNLDVAIMNEQQIFSGGQFEVRPFAEEDLRLYISGYPKNSDQEEIPPDLDNPQFLAACKDLPHISSSYGVWERSDWEEISHRVTSFMGYNFTRHFEAVNLRSVVLNLKVIPCSAVSDARFGYISEDMDIFNIPLQVKSHLCCLWHKKNENPLIADFVHHLDTYYQ